MKKNLLKRIAASVVGTAVIAGSTPGSTSVSAQGENYYKALALSLYFFDANRCGDGAADNCLNWRGACHTYDGESPLDIAENLDASAKAVVSAASGGNTVDVSGGFHDAGDHIKFNLTMGFAASSLALSSYMNPGVYEKAGCDAHLRDILRDTCDYLMKTTFLNEDGSVAAVCHTVADGGVDHSIWTAPETQTYERKTYWLTPNKNNSAVCGEMACALAGTSYIMKDYDPAYSAECMKYAKALYEFGTKHVGNEASGMSFYSTDSMYQDEMALAQAWFYICGEGDLPTVKPTKDGCYNDTYYDYYLYSWDKVWSGYSTLMYKLTGDSVYSKEMQFELANKGGCPENKYNAAGWGASRYNCALQMEALGLADGNPDSSFAKGAKYQMDYILGSNPLGYSFLMGYGSKWPTHIHHRAANPGEGNQTSSDNPESKYVLYGALIGGPDSDGNYQDHADSYQFTEPALDYNGCFALACAGLANLYGGDASEIKGLIAQASEIDADFVFGAKDSYTPPAPTDPTQPTQPTDPTDPDDKSYIVGDVNGDGAVNVFDVVLMRREMLYHAAEWEVPDAVTFDVDGDRKFRVNDIVLLSRYVAGEDVELIAHKWEGYPAP